MGGDTTHLTFNMKGKDLDKKETFFGDVDPNPFLLIYKRSDKQNFVKVYETEVSVMFK